MATITISLPDTLKSFVESQIETKGYGNVSEYFRSLLRDAQEKEKDARLEALLLEGLASGKGDVPDAAFWTELKAEAAQLLAARPRKSGAR
jgi:antitoxin ParD1/3/4